LFFSSGYWPVDVYILTDKRVSVKYIFIFFLALKTIVFIDDLTPANQSLHPQ